VRTATINRKYDHLPMKIQRLIESSIDGGDVISIAVDNFDQNLVDALLEELDQKVSNLPVPKKIRKKLFHISVELIQNLYIHTQHTPKDLGINGNKFGFYILVKLDNLTYKIIVGNFVDKDTKISIEQYLSLIKSLNDNDLKALYMNILHNKEFSKKGGGGLGFIDIAKKSKGNFEYSFLNYNLDMYLYKFEVTIFQEKN
jgi:hypothetical protein